MKSNSHKKSWARLSRTCALYKTKTPSLPTVFVSSENRSARQSSSNWRKRMVWSANWPKSSRHLSWLLKRWRARTEQFLPLHSKQIKRKSCSAKWHRWRSSTPKSSFRAIQSSEMKWWPFPRLTRSCNRRIGHFRWKSKRWPVHIKLRFRDLSLSQTNSSNRCKQRCKVRSNKIRWWVSCKKNWWTSCERS